MFDGGLGQVDAATQEPQCRLSVVDLGTPQPSRR